MTIAALGCASHRIEPPDYGILPCPISTQDELLAPGALQCCWPARHGPRRTLSHDSHYDALVIDVEVSDFRDAREIANRFVKAESSTYAEILLYAHPAASMRSSRVRRVRWSRGTGFEVLDFVAAEE